MLFQAFYFFIFRNNCNKIKQIIILNIFYDNRIISYVHLLCRSAVLKNNITRWKILQCASNKDLIKMTFSICYKNQTSKNKRIFWMCMMTMSGWLHQKSAATVSVRNIPRVPEGIFSFWWVFHEYIVYH